MKRNNHKVYKPGKWYAVFKFKKRYYKVVDVDVNNERVLVCECKKFLWWFIKNDSRKFWVSGKEFKKYEKIF